MHGRAVCKYPPKKGGKNKKEVEKFLSRGEITYAKLFISYQAASAVFFICAAAYEECL